MGPGWPQTLSKSQFDKAATSLSTLAQLEPQLSSSLEQFKTTNSNSKWKWCEHPTFPGYGYLERKGLRRTLVGQPIPDNVNTDDDQPVLNEEDDPAALIETVTDQDPGNTSTACIATLFICWSTTFAVPVLYFTAHHTNGSPLSAKELILSTIFHPRLSTSQYPFNTLTSSTAERLPFLSQGDHPTLNTPCWFLHPCETETIVSQVLEESRAWTGRESDWERDWLETWLMVVGSVVDLRD
ncbi:hypothetical protein T439DRAFT_325522 [Meredithblackwellia eburnea MCA 4105]